MTGQAWPGDRSPLVSIVIPCYNPGEFLGQAIESAVGQSHAPIEVIVVDDGSTEDLQETVARWSGVRYLRQPNRGVSSARNLGAAESRGAFLVFLDADDRLLPDAVRDGLGELASHPDAAFAAGLCYPIDRHGTPLPFQQQPPLGDDHYVEMLEANFIWMPAQVLYRRTAFEASGGFDPAESACADYDLYLRIIRDHRVVCHRRLVAEYRFHDRNMSGDPGVMLVSAVRALKRQWPHVRKEGRYREAYFNGMRFWREFYGSRLVARIRTNIRQSQTRPGALRGAAILFRHHPGEAFRQIGRKIRATVLNLARG